MSKETSCENSTQEEPNIGDLLRSEREKKGIKKNQLAEIIKVRESVIDALENEEWDKLPARVFIKGFIRSYTIAIGYDTNKVLRQFDKCVPVKDEDTPVPLTATKKKNEDFFKELDKDRNEKGCEYAILVSLLESDNELYNSGIVDVSHRYPKMYVIRPQFFISMITLLRNASMKSLEYKTELAVVKAQNIDITNFSVCPGP